MEWADGHIGGQPILMNQCVVLSLDTAANVSYRVTVTRKEQLTDCLRNTVLDGV